MLSIICKTNTQFDKCRTKHIRTVIYDSFRIVYHWQEAISVSISISTTTATALTAVIEDKSKIMPSGIHFLKHSYHFTNHKISKNKREYEHSTRMIWARIWFASLFCCRLKCKFNICFYTVISAKRIWCACIYKWTTKWQVNYVWQLNSLCKSWYSFDGFWSFAYLMATE